MFQYKNQESQTCPQCLELNYPSYRNAIIESLGFDALEFNCKWSEVEDVKHLMTQFGITNEEMEKAIESKKNCLRRTKQKILQTAAQGR